MGHVMGTILGMMSILILPRLLTLYWNWVGEHFSVPINRGKQNDQNERQTINFPCSIQKVIHAVIAVTQNLIF